MSDEKRFLVSRNPDVYESEEEFERKYQIWREKKFKSLGYDVIPSSKERLTREDIMEYIRNAMSLYTCKECEDDE